MSLCTNFKILQLYPSARKACLRNHYEDYQGVNEIITDFFTDQHVSVEEWRELIVEAELVH